MKVTFALVVAIATVAATETQTVTAEPSMAAYPNGHAYGCLPGNVSAKLPFCNASLTVSERLEDLVGRLTLDEKIGLLAADSATKVSSCNSELRARIEPHQQFHLKLTHNSRAPRQ